MSPGTILLSVVILMLIGILPVWPHARSWGYAPSGLAGAVQVILIVLFVMGRLQEEEASVERAGKANKDCQPHERAQ